MQSFFLYQWHGRNNIVKIAIPPSNLKFNAVLLKNSRVSSRHIEKNIKVYVETQKAKSIRNNGEQKEHCGRRQRT